LSSYRYFGFWSLVSIGLNAVIGSGFFTLPAVFFGYVGVWSPWLILLVGACLLPIGLSFAEIGSRFGETGGPYAYLRTAFGPFAGFQASWLMWITRGAAHASVLSATLAVVGDAFPRAGTYPAQICIIAVITTLVATMNIVGTRQAAWFLNTVAVAKFCPIAVLLFVGVFYMDWRDLAAPTVVHAHDVTAASLVMAFALSGFELVSVPAGESAQPFRHVPRALLTVIVTGTLVVMLANLVAIGVLKDPSAYAAPLAEVARRMGGSTAIALLAATAIATAIGHNMSSLLTASRLLWRMGETGDLPVRFSRLSSRFNTPTVPILISAVAAGAMAATNSYKALAILSGLTRLLIFAGVCAATLQLRTHRFDAAVSPARFVAPLRSLVPSLGVAVSLLMLTGITLPMIFGTLLAVSIGTGYYVSRMVFLRRRSLA